MLAQLESRPVVVGAGLGGYVALAAMGDGGQRLARGLVLAEMAAGLAADGPSPDPAFLAASDASEYGRLTEAVEGLALPVMVVRDPAGGAATTPRFAELAPHAEVVETAELAASGRLDAFNAALVEFLERHAPRAPIVYESGSDPRTLRDAMGCFGTGVVIAATLDTEGNPAGLTANSFTTVSLDPPLLLFCIARTANSFPAFEAAETFSVNVLHIGQQPDSLRFAKRAPDRFVASPWERWETGVPVLSGSLASFECDRHAWHEAGDHLIVVGRVRRAKFEPHRDPLLFFHGAYRRLHFF